MKTRKVIIGALLVLVGLPAALVLAIFITYSVLNRTNGSLVSSGEKRDYLLYVPGSYLGGKSRDPYNPVKDPPAPISTRPVKCGLSSASIRCESDSRVGLCSII
jgi:hypothetical protein